MGINMCVWRMRLHFSRYRTIRTFPSPPPAAYMSNTRFPYPKHIPPPPHPSLYTHMWAYIHMYRYIHVPERSVPATIQLPGDHPAHSRAPSWCQLTAMPACCCYPSPNRPPPPVFASYAHGHARAHMVTPPRRPPRDDATAVTRSGAASWCPLTPLPLFCCPPSPYVRAAAAFCMPRCPFPTGTTGTQTTTSCAARHLLSASPSISLMVTIHTRPRSIGTTRNGPSSWT